MKGNSNFLAVLSVTGTADSSSHRAVVVVGNKKLPQLP